jgi:hypothetical protein
VGGGSGCGGGRGRGGSPVGKVGGWARAVPLAGSQDSRSESEQWGGAWVQKWVPPRPPNPADHVLAGSPFCRCPWASAALACVGVFRGFSFQAASCPGERQCLLCPFRASVASQGAAAELWPASRVSQGNPRPPLCPNSVQGWGGIQWSGTQAMAWAPRGPWMGRVGQLAPLEQGLCWQKGSGKCTRWVPQEPPWQPGSTGDSPGVASPEAVREPWTLQVGLLACLLAFQGFSGLQGIPRCP